MLALSTLQCYPLFDKLKMRKYFEKEKKTTTKRRVGITVMVSGASLVKSVSYTVNLYSRMSDANLCIHRGTQRPVLWGLGEVGASLNTFLPLP